MGQTRIRKNLYQRYGKEKAREHIAAYEARVKANLAKEAIYLQIIQENKLRREQSYENRTAIKAGTRESCKQRKRRLCKEYLASKNK